MAKPSITRQHIAEGIELALQKLPRKTPEVNDMFIQPAIDPFTPLPVVNAPIVAPIQEARTIVPALTPPITKEVIIAPPMAVQTSSVLPLLAAGAILLMQ